jgi:hypothetical protein
MKVIGGLERKQKKLQESKIYVVEICPRNNGIQKRRNETNNKRTGTFERKLNLNPEHLHHLSLSALFYCAGC